MKFLQSVPLFLLLVSGSSRRRIRVGATRGRGNSILALTSRRRRLRSKLARGPAIFKQQLTEREWVDTASAVRTPFGKLASRQLQSARYSTTLPGAPEGEYVVLTFEAEYEHMPAAIETVTPMLDDGEWRVAGYYVRPATDGGS